MRNFKFLNLASVVGAGLLMSACASNYDVAKVAAMPSAGDAFSTALQKHYTERAQFEFTEGDWRSVNFFNTKGVEAAGGPAPALQAISERGLKKDVDYITAAHTRLSRALAGSAPSASPDACALSQVWLEHWMEQSEEGHQPDDIATARSAYEHAIPDCVGGPAPMVHSPTAFIVYFDFNSSALNADGKAVVASLAHFLKAHPGKQVSLLGHTDRSGDNAYNVRLAASRVQTVHAALAAAGVKTVKSAAGHGEGRPSVMTADGVKNAQNRRVEINIVN